MADQPNQPTNGNGNRVPRPAAHKIAAGTLGASMSIILIWLMHTTTSVVMPVEVAQAFTTLVTTAVSMAIPDDMEA